MPGPLLLILVFTRVVIMEVRRARRKEIWLKEGEEYLGVYEINVKLLKTCL